MSFADRLIDRALRRNPDFTIGGEADPYLRRWWLIPRNRFLNICLHQILRSDDDRALHDHPFSNVSILLRGSYIEHTIAAGGVERQRVLSAPALRVRPFGSFAHRLELPEHFAVEVGSRSARAVGEPVECWSLFITGPRYRQWGFHCKDRWVHWKTFTSPMNKGEIGRGCE